MQNCHTRYLQTCVMTTLEEVIKLLRVVVTTRGLRGWWTAFTKLCCKMVKVATGKTVIPLKTSPFIQKYALHVLFIQLLLSQDFFPFSKSKKFPKNCAISLNSYTKYFIFTFN